MYELFEHTADLGLRVVAPDLPTLFADAARGLFAMIVADPHSIRPQRRWTIELPGSEHELLLFDWLSELLYLFDTQHALLCEFDVRLDQAGLHATVGGETWDPSRHALEHEVKAITYHGLRVQQRPDGWAAEVIVDI